MKCKVQLMQVVTLTVEGKSEDQIQDWLNATTPEEAYLLAYNNGGNPTTTYDEEIICTVGKNLKADYIIKEEK